MDDLRVENIHAAYRKKEVLRGVSIGLRKGEIVALIGPNGAGKSTVLKVITGFIKPVNGQVYLAGKEVSSFSTHERINAGLGYFMQGGEVFPNLTVTENLEIGAANIFPDERNRNISAVFDFFYHLRALSKKGAGLLSGGERQALALAMVLVRRPRWLLLDEPSAGLSPKLVREMLEKVSELNRNWGITILIVEQNVREALNVADRAIALVNGSVASETDHPKVWIAEGQLDKLFLGVESVKARIT